MKDRKSLALLIERARGEREDAARSAALHEQARQRAQRTLDTLLGYRNEYLRGAPVNRDTAFDPRLLACHRSFTARLEVAITEQERLCAQARDQANQASQALVERQRKLSAFEQLDARALRELSQREARSEQRHQDEMAAQQAARLREGGDLRVD